MNDSQDCRESSLSDLIRFPQHQKKTDPQPYWILNRYNERETHTHVQYIRSLKALCRRRLMIFFSRF
jgi:hypothetical protein